MTDQTSQNEYEIAAAEAFDESAPMRQVLGQLGPRLLAEFAQAEMDRRLTEDRWLSDLRQYRGVYDPDVLAKIGPARSKAFVRKTRVKVKTVDSRVADLLFPAGSEKNWSIGPTPKPTVSKEQRTQIAQRLQKMAQFQQDQMQAQSPDQPVAPVRLSKEVIDDAVMAFVKDAAKAMSLTIEDQLVEARYKEVCLKAIHSGHLFGTGIVKGPLIERRVRTRFVMEGGKWSAKDEAYVVPFVDYVPLWRFYPDMAATTLSDCRYAYERHLMTSADMADLAERKTFNRALIINYIKTHPRGELRVRYIDNELKIIGQRHANQGQVAGQYEVLERWGWLTGEDLRQVGVEVPEERAHESFFANIWLLPNGEVIKAVLQPINGVTWPYHLYSFDKDDTSLFSEGLGAVMRDDQTMLNAAVRMMLDNSAITSGPMVEVTPSLLSSYEQLDEMAPWKVWIRNQANPGQAAVRAIELPSKLGDLSAMAKMFEANADEVTAIPRYMTGENATTGAAGTAMGMSMLMGAANIVIKDLVSAWDEGVTRTFLQALYRWNMQFNPDNSIKGDFDVKARGTASMVAKEVRGRQLNEFAAQTANPLDAPYVKRDVLNRQRAEANELSDCVKTEEEVQKENQGGPAAMQAQMAQQMQQIQLALQQAQLAFEQAKISKAEAEVNRIKAETALTQARAIDVKVTSVFAALQAGGVATQSPHIAPAGDEILRSSGWTDATPEPTIAELNAAGVQGELGGGMLPTGPDLQPQTGHVGQRSGVETAVIE